MCDGAQPPSPPPAHPIPLNPSWRQDGRAQTPSGAPHIQGHSTSCPVHPGTTPRSRPHLLLSAGQRHLSPPSINSSQRKTAPKALPFPSSTSSSLYNNTRTGLSLPTTPTQHLLTLGHPLGTPGHTYLPLPLALSSALRRSVHWLVPVGNGGGWAGNTAQSERKTSKLSQGNSLVFPLLLLCLIRLPKSRLRVSGVLITGFQGFQPKPAAAANGRGTPR